MVKKMRRFSLAKTKRAPGSNVISDSLTLSSQFAGGAAVSVATFPKWMSKANRKGKK